MSNKSNMPTPKWSDEHLLNKLKTPEGEYFKRYIEQCIAIKYQRKTVRWTVVAVFVSIIFSILSLYFAVIQPAYDKNIQNEIDIENNIKSFYTSVATNEVIFTNNSNELNQLKSNTSYKFLPNKYINFDLQTTAQETLKNKIGMMNYEFLMNYSDQTRLLNNLIDALNSSIVAQGINSKSFNNEKETYLDLMNYLNLEKWDETKLNYGMDSNCLLNILRASFSYIKDERNSLSTCANDSLNRIYYYFGYFPVDTPTWMKPLLRDAVKSREDIKRRKDINWDDLFSM